MPHLGWYQQLSSAELVPDIITFKCFFGISLDPFNILNSQDIHTDEILRRARLLNIDLDEVRDEFDNIQQDHHSINKCPFFISYER